VRSIDFPRFCGIKLDGFAFLSQHFVFDLLEVSPVAKNGTAITSPDIDMDQAAFHFAALNLVCIVYPERCGCFFVVELFDNLFTAVLSETNEIVNQRVAHWRWHRSAQLLPFVSGLYILPLILTCSR